MDTVSKLIKQYEKENHDNLSIGKWLDSRGIKGPIRREIIAQYTTGGHMKRVDSDKILLSYVLYQLNSSREKLSKVYRHPKPGWSMDEDFLIYNIERLMRAYGLKNILKYLIKVLSNDQKECGHEDYVQRVIDGLQNVLDEYENRYDERWNRP